MSSRSCPACKTQGETRRVSRRGFWERRVLYLFLIRPYRCRACSRRFYGLTWPKKAASANQEADGSKTGSESALENFLAPEDPRRLEDFMRELQAAERRVLGSPSEGEPARPAGNREGAARQSRQPDEDIAISENVHLQRVDFSSKAGSK